MSYELPPDNVNQKEKPKTPDEEKQARIQEILDKEAEFLIQEITTGGNDTLNNYYGGRLDRKNRILEEQTKKPDEEIEIIETTKEQLRLSFQSLLKKEISRVLEIYPNWNIDPMSLDKDMDDETRAEQQLANQEFIVRLRLLKLSFNTIASNNRNSDIFSGNTEEEKIKNVRGFVANETGRSADNKFLGDDEKMKEYLQISDDSKAEAAKIFRKNYPGSGY